MNPPSASTISIGCSHQASLPKVATATCPRWLLSRSSVMSLPRTNVVLSTGPLLLPRRSAFRLHLLLHLFHLRLHLLDFLLHRLVFTLQCHRLSLEIGILLLKRLYRLLQLLILLLDFLPAAGNQQANGQHQRTQISVSQSRHSLSSSR